jgi:hypothetical protein
MAYRLALPAEMETTLADAMWWKFNSMVGGEPPTFEQKQAHAMTRVKEFLLGIVREYQMQQGTEAAVAQVRDQVNAAITEASASFTIEQVAE